MVGATPEPYHGGQHLVVNLTLGYKGPIYPVNPKYDEILGLKCYPRVSDIEGPLDLALIFIPAQAVPQVLEDCITKRCARGNYRIERFRRSRSRREGPAGSVPRHRSQRATANMGTELYGT